MILADENINHSIISSLRESGIHVVSIFENYRGYTDEEVIALSLKLNYTILTEDKDFGEWVFAHHVANLSVIFLRYSFLEISNITKSLCILILQEKLIHPVFITLTPKKIRIRQL